MRHVIYLIMALLLSSCAHGGGTGPAAFTETLYAPRYADGFSIMRLPQGDATLLEVRSPWQGSGNAQRRLVIDRGGHAGTDGQPDVQRIEGPARRIVCMSSTHVAMLGAIGCSDRIVGVSGLDFISDPHVTANRDASPDLGNGPGGDHERN